MRTEFSQPSVLNWEGAIDKEVRTKEGEILEYVVVNDKESIIILSSDFREYRIPKSHLTEFDGSMELTDLEFGEVDQYEIRCDYISSADHSRLF